MVDTAAFEHWAILELMGHRRLAGVVSEAEIAGAGFIRIDVYANGDVEPRSTAFYGPASVYAITPTDEATCRTHATPWAERLQLPAAGDVVDLVDEHMDELDRDRDLLELSREQDEPTF